MIKFFKNCLICSFDSTPVDQSSPAPRAVAQFSSRTRYNDNDHDTSAKSLCRECRRIDWPSITDSGLFDIEERFSRQLRIFKQKSRRELLKSNCRICRLVGYLVSPQYGSSPLIRALKLHDRPLCIYFEIWDALGSKEQVPYVRLALRFPKADPAFKKKGFFMDERFIIAHKFRNNETAGIRTLEPLRVNFDFLRQMLNKCLEDHEQCQSTTVEVARLRVIDVTTKKICQASPGCEYIALSYVWGGNYACKSSQGEFPQVVQDAFTVTEALGYQYLWVDRYCIDQNPNSPHLQSMINQMDLVYSNACATIVAASGNSASGGLPGISVPRYQAHADIGETHLVEVSNVVKDIMLSKWFTRGWTYQEWYFSRRRLIFADNEVVFLCNQKMEKETVSGHEFYPFGHNGSKFPLMEPQWSNQRVESWDLRSMIELYSKRDLSHDCDSLNAFAGILRHYEAATESYSEPLSHLWGVPIQLNIFPIGGSAWFDLIWHHEAIAHRRNVLPSWSWSGWGGPVNFGLHRLVIRTPEVELASQKRLGHSTDEIEGVTSVLERVVRIQVYLDDRTLDLYNFYRERQLNLHREINPKELHITSFITPLRFRKVYNYPRRWHSAEEYVGPLPPKIIPTFFVTPGIFLGALVNFDRVYDSELHKLGLILPSQGQFKDPDYYYIIVLHPVADGKYERAGLLTLNYYVHHGDMENWGFGVFLDENDNPIPNGSSRYTDPRNEALSENLFLQNAEWKTICLI